MTQTPHNKLSPVNMTLSTSQVTAPRPTPPPVRGEKDSPPTPEEIQLIADRLAYMFAHFSPNESIAILIDGPNQYYTTKDLGFQVDYLKFQELFRRCGQLKSSYYFSALTDEDYHQPLRSLMTWMANHGYRTVSKTSKKMNTPLPNGSLYKGNMDVEITVYALEHCKNVDHIVLASGDGDFQYLVETLQKNGKKVTVVSSEQCQSCRIAPELRNQADGFIDLNMVKPLIARVPPLKL